MSMIKQNLVEPRRTPAVELHRPDDNWDKEAAAKFSPKTAKDTPKSKRTSRP